MSVGDRAVERIAFVGLGHMGAPMAARMLAKGLDVRVFDARGDVATAFVARHGGHAAARLAEALQEADAVITMLPRDDDVRSVMLGDGGVAQHLHAGGIAIDMGTSTPSSTIEIGSALIARGIEYVDAPVMGGVQFALDGTLDIMAGGDAGAIGRCAQVFAALGRKTWHCGASGSGHALKAVANFLNAATLVTFIEGIEIGRRSGLGTDFLVEALTSMCTGRQHPLEKKIVAQVMTGRYASGMAIALIAKDVGIAENLAHSVGARSDIVEIVHSLWDEAAGRLGADSDQTLVARLWDEEAGARNG